MLKSEDCSQQVCADEIACAETTTQSQLIVSRGDLRALGILVSNTTLLRWEADGRFPRRIRMGGTSVAWIAAEIDTWIAERAEERARHHYADAKL